MAPVLQCPECGTRHPLDAVGIRSAFPCTGCGRTLKVPEQARALVPEVPARAEPASVSSPITPPPVPDLAPEPDGTRVFSTAPPVRKTPSAAVPPGLADDDLAPIGVEAPAAVPAPGRAAGPSSRPAPGAPLGPIPGRWARLGMWIIAVPLAFLVVFGLAKAFGLLTTNDITDVALAEGWQRFVPIGRLVPFVALAAAAFVHGGAYGIARFRASRSTGSGASSPSGRPRSSRSSRSSRPARPSGSSRPTRPPRQSSGDTR